MAKQTKAAELTGKTKRSKSTPSSSKQIQTTLASISRSGKASSSVAVTKPKRVTVRVGKAATSEKISESTIPSTAENAPIHLALEQAKETIDKLTKVMTEATKVSGRIESALTELKGEISRLSASLSAFSKGLETLDLRLQEVTDPARLQTQMAGIEAQLERSKAESRHGLELLGVKLDRVVNALTELRRALSVPARPGSYT